ncbi:MAG: hypothetical protein ACLTBR_00425 [Anaerostipes sp.]|uniref:hypothetical protein n=1 Tax=Anaerostipes sp. TaxID=1872530 RepID=UPI003994C725
MKSTNEPKQQNSKLKGKLEKILWICLILMFVVCVAGMFLGQYMKASDFYQIYFEMTIFSVLILTAERFYFGKEMGRDMPQIFNIGYWLIMIWALILILHYVGVQFLDFLMTVNNRVFWVIVPTLSLLWMTRYIFGDNLDWDKTDKKGWKEGRMNYSQKSNKKKVGKK